ncbi:WD repeat-containing protein 44-like isoform X2 [Eriocheir sinensis]|uniref:WD repeat-containing protein 44-like isoform X2 n=1 Tax=Eriocheir sinensis TaxID=95602 RepID=UPI0021C59B73|nr:WD repeat-containing protein 44-like isoform X2 [Eriocheir sinensis]
MSSESDPEEFYDASDVTPQRQSVRLEEGVAAELLNLNSQQTTQEQTTALANLAISQNFLQNADKTIPQQIPASTLMQPPAQPFLHPLKPSKDLVCSDQAKSEVLPAGVEKEESLSLGSTGGGKRDVEESSSACSGSLLGNLGDDDDDDEAAPRVWAGGRRRIRHPEVRRQIQTEDDDHANLPSPLGSQSSSADGIYPAGRTSHPFRVVEHDAASVQSSISLGKFPFAACHDAGMKSGRKMGCIGVDKVGKILSGLEGHIIQECQQNPELQSETKSVESSHSDPSKDIRPSGNVILASEIAGITMSPEPDLVASTKSSSSSDKSNSLPRTGQEPLPQDLPTIDISSQPQISVSDAFHVQHLPHSEPSRKDGALESLPEVSTTAPAPSVLGDITGQPGIGIGYSSSCDTEGTSVRAASFKVYGPSQLVQIPHQYPVSQVSSVPVAPPRKKRRNRHNTDDTASVSSLPSPSLTLSSVDTISIGHSLDLRQAVRGEYLVKPQDSENAKAVGPTAEEIARLEAEDTTSQASTPEVSRAPSRLADSIQQAASTSETPSTPGTPGSIPSDTASSDVAASPASCSDGPMKQLNLMVRTRSDSGKELSDAEWILQSPVDFDDIMSDKEILQQVTVLNLDTGERIALSDAESCLPKALNPLSLHIMRLTSEYVSWYGNGVLHLCELGWTAADTEHRGRAPSGRPLSAVDSCLQALSRSSSCNSNVDGPESDEESVLEVNVKKLPDVDSSAVKKKTSQLKKFLGRKMESAVNKARSLAHEVSHRHREEKDVFEDDAPAHDTMHYVKIKTTHNHKGPHEFDNLMYVQEIAGEHTGPIWCTKFSGCGRLLATAGQDHMLRVWVLKQAFNYFLDIRTKCNADIKVSPTPSQESLVSQHSGQSGEDPGSLDPTDDGSAPFMPKPFCVYTGHSADMLDISWSKNYFLLTSSMDKTVRLWHISRKECLCIFQHMDFVTAIAFHPKDDRYFISGALDGKLRLWSIPDKRVVLWNEVEGQPNLITAANFCQNGKYTVVGTYDGRCIFYETDQLKYYTQIYVRSTRGKNARGQKITGIEPLPGEDKILITSNDSRIRLYDLRDLNLSCKYKGYSNMSSQIRAGFSHDGKFIVAGSENQCIYIWKTHHDYSKFSSARRDRNEFWEGVKAHSAVVTCAVFAPHPELVFSFIEQQQEILNKATQHQEEQQQHQQQQQQQSQNKDSGTNNKGYVLVSADFNGCIKVFLKKEKPKHSSLPASALV